MQDLLGIRTAQQQRVSMSMIRRDDQKGRLEARRKLRDELALKEKQVMYTIIYQLTIGDGYI
jgi:hypothetical protein